MDLNLDGWTSLDPAPPRAAPAADVRFGMSQVGKGPRRGRVLVRPQVLRQMGLTTWRANLRLGTGANSHKLAIVPVEDGAFEFLKVGGRGEEGASGASAGTYRLILPPVPVWTEFPCPMGETAWEIATVYGRTRALIIDLPAPLVSARDFTKWQEARRG